MRWRRASFWPVYAVDASIVGRTPAGGTALPVVAFLVSAESKTGNTVPYISTTEAAWAEPASARAVARRVFLGIFIVGVPSWGSLLGGVFHVCELVEFHVPVFVAARLDAADVHGLHDVARGRVDGDRAARARELQALQDLHRLVAVDVVAELLHHLGDRRHAVE